MLVVRRTHCIHLLDIYIDVDNINTWVKDLMLSHSFEKKNRAKLGPEQRRPFLYGARRLSGDTKLHEVHQHVCCPSYEVFNFDF